MTLPQEIEKQIEDNAKKYSEVKYEETWHKKGLHRKMLLLYAHMDGATEWAGKASWLVDALEGVLRLRDLWQYTGQINPDHVSEARALLAMEEQINVALAKYKEVTNG